MRVHDTSLMCITWVKFKSEAVMASDKIQQNVLLVIQAGATENFTHHAD